MVPKGAKKFPNMVGCRRGGSGSFGCPEKGLLGEGFKFLVREVSGPETRKSRAGSRKCSAGDTTFRQNPCPEKPFRCRFLFLVSTRARKTPFPKQLCSGFQCSFVVERCSFPFAFDPGLGASDPLQQLFCVRRVSHKSEPRARVRGRGSPPQSLRNDTEKISMFFARG